MSIKSIQILLNLPQPWQTQFVCTEIQIIFGIAELGSHFCFCVSDPFLILTTNQLFHTVLSLFNISDYIFNMYAHPVLYIRVYSTSIDRVTIPLSVRILLQAILDGTSRQRMVRENRVDMRATTITFVTVVTSFVTYIQNPGEQISIHQGGVIQQKRPQCCRIDSVPKKCRFFCQGLPLHNCKEQSPKIKLKNKKK